MADLNEKIAASHPLLSRGRVWCRTCGLSQEVDAAVCIRHGWPKCCGYTMTIPSTRAKEAKTNG